MSASLACYVISLRRSTERRQAIAGALGHLGIAFDFVDAVDAKDGIDPALIDHAGTRANLGRQMSQGEIACALSHAKTYETFLQGDASHALIFEDDAIPTPGLKRFLDARLYASAPMFQFYHHHSRVFRGPGRPLFGEVRSRRLALPACGAVGYTVDRAAAQRLFGAAIPVRGVADWPMDTSDLGAEVTLPMLVEHPLIDPAQSLLAEERRRDRRYGIGRYLTAAYLRRKWRKAVSVRVA